MANALWRPELFGAAGTGFLGDPHLEDGVHVRWHVDHRLGLPYEKNGKRKGLFSVAFRRGQPGTVAAADLFAADGIGLPIRDSSVFSQDAGLSGGFNRVGFWRRPDPILVDLFRRCHAQLISNRWWRWRWTEEQGRLRDYAQAVVDGLAPKLLDNSQTRERAEACAVDLRFAGIAAGAPAGAERPYVTLAGLDRSGRIVARDWVGLTAAGAPKVIARLRGAGLAEVTWQPVTGQPAATLERIRWVLCHDYCGARLWLDSGETFWFHADPAFHTPAIVTQHYAPFKAVVDPALGSDAIANLLLTQPDLDKLLAQLPDSEAMAAHRVSFGETADSQAGVMQLSLLQTLIASGVDPVMARILGLYAFLDPHPFDAGGSDIRIEAELPFFDPANLALLDQRIQALRPGASAQFFLDGAKTLGGTRLCALVIAPTLGPKAPVPAPGGFTTALDVTDLPSQDIEGQVELLVQARLEAPIDPEETQPHLTPVAYAVERNLSDTGYVNVAEGIGAEPDILDKIGLLPPVYFPGRTPDAEQSLRVADDFSLTGLQNATVRYRLRAYDVFGRPSAAVDGPDHPITPPCKPPRTPLNPAALVVVESGLLILELRFALDGASPPLEADWQQLEVMVHRLPEPDPLLPDPRPPGAIDWPGKVTARRLLIDVLADHQLHSAIAPSCIELEWSPDLQASGAPAEQCAILYPPPAPQLLAEDPESLPFAETGLRSYRLRVVVGTTTGLPADRYRWCARLRILGQCPLSGTALASAEVHAAADWLIPPAPPAAVAPITAVIPLSSYPDTLGDSYYDLDLSGYNLSDGDLVNVYMARLERLGETAASLVADGLLLDQLAFETLARESRRPYELLSEAPFEYFAATPFYRVKVPGDLRRVYVLAVVGANPYLQEQPWSSAACSLFTTPEPVPDPLLRFERMQPLRDAVGLGARLAYSVELAVPPDAAHPPKIQLFRYDLSSGAKAPHYVGEAVGTLAPADPAEPEVTRYGFAIEDRSQDDWRRYEYEAVLVRYAVGHAAYLKSRQSVRTGLQAGWGGQRSPLRADDRILVAAASQGLDVTVTFDCGELDFALVRSLDGRISSRFQGRLRQGRLYGLAERSHSLAVESQGGRRRYRLTVHDEEAQPTPAGDPDAPPAGQYVLRLTFGQQMTWSNRENIIP